MNLTVIILAIVITVLVILFIKVTKKILKIFISICLLLIILSAILGYFVYKDITDLKNNLGTSENIFLLDKDNNYIAGFTGVFEDADIIPLTTEQLSGFTGQDSDYILGDHYKLIVIDSTIFNNLDPISVGETTLSSEEALSMLQSDLPITEFFSGIELVFDDSELRGMLFALLLSEAMKQDSFNFFISGLKDEKITLYPEVFTFKLLRFIPLRE